MTRYDTWKTASPPAYDSDGCCTECYGDAWSDCCGAPYDGDSMICLECKEHCDSDGCSDENCLCHWTKEQHKEAAGEARYEAMRDEKEYEK